MMLYQFFIEKDKDLILNVKKVTRNKNSNVKNK